MRTSVTPGIAILWFSQMPDGEFTRFQLGSIALSFMSLVSGISSGVSVSSASRRTLIVAAAISGDEIGVLISRASISTVFAA